MFQTNVAQEGRQNNHCSNVTGDETVDLTGGRLQGRCVTEDGSFNGFSKVHTGPADAKGGGGTTRLAQQNVAQRGRQNNDCASRNTFSLTASGDKIQSNCADEDTSVSDHTYSQGRGASAEGRSGGNFDQQNVAQAGRQNNICDSPDYVFPDLTGSRFDTDCTNKDASVSRHTSDKSGGAQARGAQAGSSEVQDIAQEGRQNNFCANPNSTDADPVSDSRVDADCANKDASLSEKTRHKGGGAQAKGGALAQEQQNIAQEGRQNNSCANPNVSTLDLSGARTDTDCVNKDVSRTKHSLVKGGPARAEGGSGEDVFQQNIAQEGRQNNACDNANDSDITATGGRSKNRCATVDGSKNRHTVETSRGAAAVGGSGVADLSQQNIAQSGRQNNACANANDSDITATGGRSKNRCATVDGSKNRHTVETSRGAEAVGGPSAADLSQQNIAQEGRQNNACANHNGLNADVTGARQDTACVTVDRSVNAGTKKSSGGASVEGGSSVADLFQQNIAQEGRQNNACGNTNNLTLTANGGSTQNQCVAVDRSVNIGTQED
ncbi:hypothetical protein AQJ43_33335 [Streptomyces avermitilis]|uniref:Uncharacterized protein n=1 Tax=Streptomyces avermitilis TaxID=33903 RepID=A0A4D4MRF8_STRAX|nr:hypothetical protein [Streptomyces avermitilis]MYT01218.1 hypothetical protein [Streptomyces sp. SID5469]KUN50426.1 hypothetical protein AQJ43_33335 [Streptomyces avermitilis]OOV30822.1 hypothetical protein SM007_16680 [Streptomyces avermitilis]BBJ53815.1 hypothetical protein SAVMC3_64440 [Streptomyces avermitilis]GDY65818.1 hypothetical protein SAV14893_052110 [Streptomyces avermitilis]